MESCYRGYQKQLPKPIKTVTRTTLYLFAERKQWDDFTIDFTGRQAPLYLKIKKGAYYLKDACVAYNIGAKRTFSVIAHEGWHHFNKKHFRYRLPSWFDEGIAMLFEASRYEKGLFYFDSSRNISRLGGLKKTLLNRKMIPLKQLIAMNPGEAILIGESEGISNDAIGNDTVMAFYSQSYALVRFLCEDDYGKRLSNYHQMLIGGLNGSWPLEKKLKRIAADRNIPLTVRWNRVVGPQLFKLYISDDFAQIEQEYITFCRKIVYRVRFK